MKYVCEECGKEFEDKPSRKRRFCSVVCMGKMWSKIRVGKKSPNWKGGKVKCVCKECGKELEGTPSEKRRFCSPKCSQEAHVGENSTNWKGGLSFEPYSPEFNGALKRSIRERDNCACQICGECENGRCHDVHHIDYDKQNNSSNNLILLCHSCHAKTNGNREYWQLRLEARFREEGMGGYS